MTQASDLADCFPTWEPVRRELFGRALHEGTVRFGSDSVPQITFTTQPFNCPPSLRKSWRHQAHYWLTLLPSNGSSVMRDMDATTRDACLRAHLRWANNHSQDEEMRRFYQEVCAFFAPTGSWLFEVLVHLAPNLGEIVWELTLRRPLMRL